MTNERGLIYISSQKSKLSLELLPIKNFIDKNINKNKCYSKEKSSNFDYTCQLSNLQVCDLVRERAGGERGEIGGQNESEI